MNKLLQKLSIMAFSAVIPFAAQPADIELYDYASQTNWGIRPKVLIIFDVSGSMNDTTAGRADYDSAETYSAIGRAHSFNERFIYYTKAGLDGVSFPDPDDPNEQRRFPEIVNNCNSSQRALTESGFYVGKFAEYYTTGSNSNTWQEIPDNNGANIKLVDCLEDIEEGDIENAEGWQTANQGKPFDGPEKGFPVDGGKNAPPYQEGTAENSPENYPAIFNSGTSITLYTDNYLRWYHGGCALPKNEAGEITSNTCDEDDVPTETKSLLEFGKEAITNVTSAVSNIDFGLMVFNINGLGENYGDGARVVLGIGNHDAETTLNPLIDGLTAYTATPLCESMYEAYRYAAGLGVYFGDGDSAPRYTWTNRTWARDYRPNTPPRDTSVENNGVYISPFDKCVDKMHVVLVTDGAPFLDQAANDEVESEFGYSSSDKMLADTNGAGNVDDYTHLPNITEALATQDLLPDEKHPEHPDPQTITTHIIGMGSINNNDQVVRVLEKSAENGKGEYYDATEPGAGLEAAFIDIIHKVLEEQASYTSPAVATNNFDRTQNLDSIYYAMFLPTSPQSKKHWWGNLKKFKVVGENTIQDANGAEAMDEGDGNVKASAKSFWSEVQDGDDVTKGGILEHLQKRRTSRNFYSDVGDGITRIDSLNESDIAPLLGVDSSEVAGYVSWIKGVDVDDEDSDNNTTEKRSQQLGDILHSRPLALNFGKDGSQDIRLVVGTNTGVLHMFKDLGTTVEESWAYLPGEFWGLQSKLRHYDGVRDYYGIDSSPVGFKHGDKTIAYFGLRRGGKSYYAVDLTNPDSPSLLWKIDSTMTGYTGLGQTWSEPVITYIPGTGTSTPVMIVGGGYDTNKDSDAVGSEDAIGRGVYIINALTGDLIWSSVGGSGSGQYAGFKDSMPGKVATLDSDRDGLVDRLYVSDTGANVFRVDLPSGDKSTWTVHKLASLGGTDATTDRRFFYEPSVAQTVVNVKTETVVKAADGTESKLVANQSIPIDAVLIGSGNRSHPLGTTTADMFFMLQDRNIQTESLSDSEIAARGGVIQLSDLYDATSQAINKDNTNEEKEAELLAYGAKRGWYHDLREVGEKSLSSAIVVEGTVYYTTYIPTTSGSTHDCVPIGSGRIYAMNLQYGYNQFLWKYIDTGVNVPDTPQLFAGKEHVNIICAGCEAIDNTGKEVCMGDGCDESAADPNNPDLIQTPLQLRPKRIYYFSKEQE